MILETSLFYVLPNIKRDLSKVMSVVLISVSCVRDSWLRFTQSPPVLGQCCVIVHDTNLSEQALNTGLLDDPFL